METIKFIQVSPVIDCEEIDSRTFPGFCSNCNYEIDYLKTHWPIYINVSKIKYFQEELYVTEPNTFIWVDYQDECIEVYETPEEIMQLINGTHEHRK